MKPKIEDTKMMQNQSKKETSADNNKLQGGNIRHKYVNRLLKRPFL